VVLAQVAFSALLDARSRATRNTFDRKVADFVLCTKAFEVIAVIELDDSSHQKKAAADVARDELLILAGYQVLRFAKVPDVAELGAAVLIPSKQDAVAAVAPRKQREPSSLVGDVKEK
jgi:very-short-patch-repair endonuclease